MKKIILLFGVGMLLLFFLTCVPKKEIVWTFYSHKLERPIISSLDSTIYICAKYTLNKYLFYEGKSRKIYRYKGRETCSCFTTLLRLLEWRTKSIQVVGCNTIIIWDKDFIANYILPEFKGEKDRKIIEYTLANSNDSTFTPENIIDYKNKVIINDKVYYYPLKIKTGVRAMVKDYEWFKSVVPKSSWIYNSDCFDDGEGMYANLLIPLLEEDTANPARNSK
jgi:hypothetical protein